jgi:phage repressor protein C with HTH and peptisase S24 domain
VNSEVNSEAETIGDRIKQCAKKLGSVQALATAAGIPKSSLDEYVGGTAAIKADRLALICAATGVDPAWLLMGIASYRYPTSDATILTTDGQPPQHEAREFDRLVEVPLYRNLLSAGDGVMAVDDEVIGTRSFDRQWIEGELRVPADRLALAVARGDSMRPTLHSGDIVLIDKRDTGPLRDDIYAVLLDGEVYVKRLQRGLDGSLDVISDNREHYKTLTLTSDAMNQREFGILGRVVWWAHTNAD